MQVFDGTVHVFVNGDAGRGKALSRWEGLEAVVQARFSDLKIWKSCEYLELIEHVRSAARGQGRFFLAAGGDGTVQAVLDGLFDEQGVSLCREVPFVGGFGLGLGNQLYKMLGPSNAIGQFFARWNPETSSECDVIRLELIGENGNRQIRYAMQSIHLGIMAAANREVKHVTGIWKWLLNWLGFRAQALVSVWQAFKDQGFAAEISDGNENWNGIYAGLHLVKHPWVAGNFVIKTPRLPGDGLIDLGFYSKPPQPMESMGLIGSFEKMGLAQSKVTYREVTSGEVKLKQPCTICFDGELASISEMRWNLLPKAILLGN